MKWLSCFAMELQLDGWAAVREMTTLAGAVPPADTPMPKGPLVLVLNTCQRWPPAGDQLSGPSQAVLDVECR